MNLPVIESSHFIMDGVSHKYDPSNLSKDLDNTCVKIQANMLGEPLDFSLDNIYHSVRILEESHAELIFIKDFFSPGKHYIGANIFTCGNKAKPDLISPRMNSYSKDVFGIVEYSIPNEGNPRKKKVAFQRGSFSNNPVTEEIIHKKIIEGRNSNGHGNHLIIDVHGCRENLEVLTDKKAMQDFLKGLYYSNDPGDPCFISQGFSPAEGFPHGGVTSFGYKLTKNTDFSTSGHTWPEKNHFAAFDFVDYKKEIDLEKIIRYVYFKLDPDNLDWNIFNRFAIGKKKDKSTEPMLKSY